MAASADPPNAAYTFVYRVFAYFGLMTVFGSLLHGFRYDASAPASNYGIAAALYVVFSIPHLIMTRAWFKKAVWGDPAGSSRERRVYIAVTIVTWLAVYILHPAVPGYAMNLEGPMVELVQFLGQAGLLFGALVFFEGLTFEAVDGLLGVPGSSVAYGHGPETPLFTEGSYARVRHPMYCGALLGGLSSLLIHPHAGQFLWVAMVGITFVGFIPIEEAQISKARGEEYQRYKEQTPYRLVRGIW